MQRQNLVIPPWIKRGIRPNDRGSNKRTLAVGMDIETNEDTGEPNLLIVCDKGTESLCFPVTKTSAFTVFCRTTKLLLSRKKRVVIGFHNLEFDIVSLLLTRRECFGNSYFEAIDRETNCILKIYFGKCIWGFFQDLGQTNDSKEKHGPRRATVIDTARFFPYSLAKVAQDLSLEHQKLPYPGQKDFQTFVAYAKNDGLVQRDLVQHIVNLHSQFDIKLTVSTPGFAQRLFRHKFVQQTIAYPPDEIAAMAFLSYHGGKNQMYCKPGFYENVNDIDIVSCYASCMVDIPSLYGRWYKTNKILSPWGIYLITGDFKSDGYSMLYNHDFSSPYDNGSVRRLDNVCISGPEAWHFKDHIQLTRCYGYVFCPNNMDNPLRDFALYLYEMKAKLDSAQSLYHFVKLLNNSLYGKFIQTVEQRKDNAIECYRAGGLFNPVIGSWITSLARVKVYDLEAKYGSLDTSTDGIKTRNPVAENRSLGGHTTKFYGDYLLLRNKCALAFNPDGTLNEKYSTTHGVFLKPVQLLRLLTKGGTVYEIKRMNRIRESLRRGYVPNTFREEARCISLPEPITIPPRIVEANCHGKG